MRRYLLLLVVMVLSASNVFAQAGVNNGTSSSSSASSSAFVVNPQTYNASGSVLTATCTATATSNVLACAGGPGDFKVGQGILIPAAGPAALYSAPTAPTVTTVGTAGAVAYDYKVAGADSWGGISAASASAGVANGNATPSPVNFSKIVKTVAGVYEQVVVYQRIGGTGDYKCYGILPYSGGTLEANYPVPAGCGRFPATAPAAAVAQDLVSKITAVGATSITIADNATTTATGVTVIHDDTQAVQAAADAIAAVGGGTLLFPSGNYNFNRVSYWTNTVWNYTNPTVEPAGVRIDGFVHLGSNITVRGTDEDTVAFYSKAVGGYAYPILSADAPTATIIPAPGLCNSNGLAQLTTYAINNVTRGSLAVVTTTAGNAANFSPGDYVYYGGGIVNNDVGCNLFSTPAAELNQVLYVRTDGTIALRYAVDKDYPFGAVGTANFVAKVNTAIQHDITYSDFTVHSPSAAIAAHGDVHVRVSRIKAPDLHYGDQVLQFSESRDIIVDDVDIYSNVPQELDMVRDMTIQNSRFVMQGGYWEIGLTQGSTAVSFLNNIITSDDSLCGYVGRCDLGIPMTLSLVSGGGDYRIIGNRLDTAHTSGASEVISDIAQNAGTPILVGNLIEGNVISQASAATGFGMDLLSNASQQVIDGNTAIVTPTTGGSAAIRIASGGVVSNNTFQLVGNIAYGGVINVDFLSNQPEPLTIIGNLIKRGASNSFCGGFDGNFTGLVKWGPGNVCVGSSDATLFERTSTGFDVSLASDTGPGALAIFGTCTAPLEGNHNVEYNSTGACSAGAAATSAGTTNCEIYCNHAGNWVQTGR